MSPMRHLPDELTSPTFLDHLPGGTLTTGGATTRQIRALVTALVHLEELRRGEAIRTAWEQARGDAPGATASLAEHLSPVLEDAGYTHLPHDEVEDAMATENTLALRLEVDLDDYEHLSLYRRNTGHTRVETRRLGPFGRSWRDVVVDGDLVLLTRVRAGAPMRDHADDGEGNARSDRLGLMHFADVPRATIDALLPSVTVRYRIRDTVVMGLPAFASGIAVLSANLLTTLGVLAVLIGAGFSLSTSEFSVANLVILAGGLIALGAYLSRQIGRFRGRQLRYQKTVDDHLLRHLVGRGPDVLTVLLQDAARQRRALILTVDEVLRDHPDGLRRSDLTAACTTWIRSRTGVDVEFDPGTILTTMAAWGMASPTDADEPLWRTTPRSDTLHTLQGHWADLAAPDPHRSTTGINEP